MINKGLCHCLSNCDSHVNGSTDHGVVAHADETHHFDVCRPVVTNRISDDCNGPVRDANHVWFQISRVDDCFAFHYSTDGVEYNMVRVFTLPVGKTVKVCPVFLCPQSRSRITS